MKNKSLIIILMLAYMSILNGRIIDGIEYVDTPPTELYSKVKYGIIIEDDINIYKSYKENEVIKKLPFKKLVYIYGYDSTRDRYLIGEKVNEDALISFYGWIKKNDLLTSRNPLLNKYGIYKKAILRNNYKSDYKISDKVYFHTASNKSSKIASNSKIFKAYFIFKEKNGYALLGDSENWNEDKIASSGNYITGWIKKDFLYEWNTRVEVEFNKGNFSEREKGFIFEETKDVKSFLSTKKLVKDNIFAKEGNNPNELDFFETRMPVLETNRTRIGDKFFTIYKLGFEANINKEIHSEMNNTKIKNKPIAIYQKLQEYKVTTSNVQILFVLDATGSMNSYIKKTKEAIIKFSNNLSSLNKDKISFGVALFRDYEDIESYKVFDFSKNIDTVKNNIESINATGGGDNPEAIYHGLIKSIDESKWIQGTTKMVFLITDSYDNEKKEDYNYEKLRQSIQKIHGDFFALKINPSNHGKDAKRQFGTSLAISKHLSEFYFVENTSKLFEKVSSRLEKENIISKEKVEGTAILNNSKNLKEGIKKVEKKYGISIKNRLLEDLTEVYGDIETLNKYLINTSVCNVGYIAEKTLKGKDVLKKEILISKYELSSLIASYTHFINSVNKSKSEKIATILLSAVNTGTGENHKFHKEDRSNLSSFLKRALKGIPINSKYLKMGEDELGKELENNTNRIAFIKDIALKIEYLFAVQGEYIIEFTKDKDGNIQYNGHNPIIKKGRMKKWFFLNTMGESFAHIPESYFP